LRPFWRLFAGSDKPLLCAAGMPRRGAVTLQSCAVCACTTPITRLAARARVPQYRARSNNEAAAAERAVMAQLRLALDIHRRAYFDDDEPRRAAE
jgi:hypothetical protein